MLDETRKPEPLDFRLPVDSLETAVQQALAELKTAGHYLAQVDSVRIDSAGISQAVTLYVTQGPQVRIGKLTLRGDTTLDAASFLSRMQTREGQILDPLRLEADLEALVTQYEEAGYPLAQVRIESITFMSGDPPRLNVAIRVDPGNTLRLKRIELAGAVRSKPAYVGRIAELTPGRTLTRYNPEEIQRLLLESGVFKEVQPPELLIDADSGAVLRLTVEEEPPGVFDLALGYLPATAQGEQGKLIGSGHLVLRNLFGSGRVASLKLNRLPGQISTLDARASDPYLFGLPVGIEGSFHGLQQDSTYGKQRYALEAGYRFFGGLQVFASVTQETTRPGQAGARIPPGALVQRIPRADASFAGLGVRYQRVDRILNPRRGFSLETNFERGRKERQWNRVFPAERDTVSERTALRQERLQARGRLYLPTFSRQVFVVGGDVAALSSNEYDESDLFRFGGATSLRGYDEERFLGRLVARSLAEYRYQIDRSSYAFLFLDVGYVETPTIPDMAAQDGSRRFYPGYGFGIQFSTNLGLINASYAVSPEAGPTSGRVHVGLSFGL